MNNKKNNKNFRELEHSLLHACSGVAIKYSKGLEPLPEDLEKIRVLAQNIKELEPLGAAEAKLRTACLHVASLIYSLEVSE